MQISQSTKISPTVLAALEENDLAQVPGGLFIRTFVRSYAAEVGLNPERTVDALLEAYPEERRDTAVGLRDEAARRSHSAKEPNLVRLAIALLIISVIVVSLLVVFARRGSDGSDDNGASSDFDERSAPQSNGL